MLGGAIAGVFPSFKAFSSPDPYPNKPFFSMRLTPEYDAEDVAFQSFAIDSKQQILFAQFSTRTKPQQTIVAEYELVPWGSGSPISVQPPSLQIGHQGLTFETGAPTRVLWAGAPGHGRSAVRFHYQKDQHPAVQRFQLFGDDCIAATITVAVSFDGSRLVAAGKRMNGNTSVNTLRIFNLKDVLGIRDGDATSNAIDGWDLPLPSDLPIQGLACTGNTVIVSCGNSNSKADKLLLSFSTSGKPIGATKINMGRRGLPQNFSYEPEGLAFFQPNGAPEPLLMIGLTTGRAEAGRTRQIFMSPSF